MKNGTLCIICTKWSNLYSFVLCFYDTTDSVCTYYTYLLYTAFLHLDNNQFVGSLPESLGKLTSLVALGISGNHITGTIPQEFESLRRLRKYTYSAVIVTYYLFLGGAHYHLWYFRSFRGLKHNHSLTPYVVY
jgi:hypothetical protein